MGCDTAHLCHTGHVGGQAVGIVDIEGDVFPGIGLVTPVDQGTGLKTRFDGKQAQGGRLIGVVAQLRGAHGGAPSAGGHDAAPVVGKKNSVDELGFATGKLGHEGDHNLVLLDTLAQALNVVFHCGIEKVAGAQPLGQRLETP